MLSSSGGAALRRASAIPLSVSPLPPEAKIVVCGGGAQGAAIAYKLAQKGLAKETVLIDKVRGTNHSDNFNTDSVMS